MAEPIILPVLPVNNQNQELTPVDASSISNLSITNNFDVSTDIIAAYLYDFNDTFLRRIEVNYKILSGNISGSTTTQLTLDPGQDVLSNGYTQGTYKVDYNFISPLVENNLNFYISEISTDRTELRVKNSTLNNPQLQQINAQVQEYLNSTDTFQGYYLDFGSDLILLGLNIAYDNGSIAVKLYQPLPDSLGSNSVFNFVRKVAEPVAFSIEFPAEEIFTVETRNLRGPNYNLNIGKEVNNSTDYANLENLLTGSTTLLDQLTSVLVERRAELNTDYTDYSNFVFFSSAAQRLDNFYFKASQIENYNNQIATLGTLPATVERSASIAKYQQDIQNIITNFDGYDYFLYYESSSFAWPKSSTTKPYTLYSTGSTQVLSWFGSTNVTSPYFGGRYYTASIYDEENQNNIYNIYPEYIRDDSDNTNFELFNNMVAQMFDQIWLYTKAIENRQDADNSLSGGISIDLVGDALKSYGITLYESNFSNNDLYTTYLGITPEGSTLPPTGSELITTYVTASADTTPFNEAQKLIYKRLYHNLPYLLKKKGTVSGLRLLLNCFGIPDTIIRINEFGGKDKNVNTWDNWQNEFNYAYYTSGSGFITASFVLNSTWGTPSDSPQAVGFRFKTDGLPQNTNTIASQSLWLTDTGVNIKLVYTGSGYTSGSYTGSVVNPYNQYATLEFYPELASAAIASVYLPFYDGGWWSVLVNRNTTGDYTLYAGNKLYQGVDGNILGFQASSSVALVSLDTDWTNSTVSTFGSASYKIFTGSFQEIRYYTQPISKSTFDAYVMNPYSIEQSERLAFRATLGGELYTSSISVHPKVTGSWITTSSFTNDSNFYVNPVGQYIPNTEYIYFDQVAAGIQNPVSTKSRTAGIILPPTGSTNIPDNKTLSPYISIQQSYAVSESLTRNVNYVEVALSPQNEINEDINSSLGYFNIGEYIGDPRQISSSATYYPDLENLSTAYFEKYTGNYNWTDYNRLVKYFDNSVFRMIQDFTPVRAGLSTGIVIKQHLLERNRQRPAQISYTQPEYTGSVTSLARDYETGSIEVFTGGDGGVFPLFSPAEYVTVFTTSSLLFSFGGVYPDNYLITSASGDYIITATLNNSDPGGLLYMVDGTSTADYPDGLKSTTTVTISNQNLVLSGSFQKGVLFYYVPGSFGGGAVLSNVTASRQTYTPVTITIDGKLGPVTKTLTNEAYYNAEFSGSVIDVVVDQLQDNPLLGKDFLISIPDQQNLSVFTNLPYSASDYISTPYTTIPFNIEPKNIDYFDNSTFTYSPGYEAVVNLTVVVSGSYTASIVPDVLATESFYVGITQNNTLLGSISSPLATIFNVGAGSNRHSGSLSGSLTLTNFTIYPGIQYKAVLFGSSVTSNITSVTASFTNATNWTVQSVNLAEQSTYYLDPTVYTLQNFPGNINQYSDYNTLLNNVYSNRVSSHYFDVDYSSDGYNPVNFGNIISQSAIYAQVQDSNYAIGSSWYNLRYNGIANTGQYNTSEIFASQSLAPGYPIDNFASYFLYFDWIGGADPQYPGGGNLHGVYLVDSTGTAITLSTRNENLGLVSNLFKKGQTATILPAVVTVGEDPTTVNIVDGGCIYETVIYYSGSDASAGQRFSVKFANDNFYRFYSRTYFNTGSTAQILTEGDTTYKWLYPLLTGSDSTFGQIQFIKPERQANQKFYFWNVKKGNYALTTDENEGVTAYEDTLLPIQYGDFIRFGTGSNPSSSLDVSFGALDFVNTLNTVAITSSQTSSIAITPGITSGSSVMNLTTQEYRIIRRTPTETFVLLQNVPTFRGPGFLIPENYNPAYNVYELAQKAGLI